MTTCKALTDLRDKDVLKVLVLGNSHGLDSTHFLGEVFKVECPGKKVILGALYYDGCRMWQHADFLPNEKDVYWYLKNATFDGASGTVEGEKWVTTKKVTALSGIADEQWDIVVMQQMNTQSGLEGDYEQKEFDTVVNYILKHQEKEPVFLWNMVWANPDGDAYHTAGSGLCHPGNPENWATNLRNWFPGENGKYCRNVLYDNIVRCAEKCIVPMERFADILPVGTAIQYALNVLDRPEENMFRDYTHLSDYGRMVVAYVWYAKIMGISRFDYIKLQDMPISLHNSKSTYPCFNETVITVSEKDKEDLRKAVNYALEKPLTNPVK